MEKHYQVGGHRFSISGEALAVVIEQLNGFEPFAEASPAIPDFIFRQEDSAVSLPAFKQMLYSFENDGTDNRFGITTHNGYLLELAPEKEQRSTCGPYMGKRQFIYTATFPLPW